MKLAIIGAAGVRTPLIIEAILKRQDRIGITDLSLMDIDGRRLEIIAALTSHLETTGQIKFRINRTTDPRQALEGADFVITTFRVGGIESRVIDEQVPLSFGILGQETTGAGGFAMGMRTIPVLLEYLQIMHQVCPGAWLINFANPAGMITEAATRLGRWKRAVGICDTPSSMLRSFANLIGAKPHQVTLGYFGLNHLGWIRSVQYAGQDHLPKLIDTMTSADSLPGIPFEPTLVRALGLIPNEYLYYYYYSHQAVENILSAGQNRGEEIAALNKALFSDLDDLMTAGSSERFKQMRSRYNAYLDRRGETYMARETGRSHARVKTTTQIKPTQEQGEDEGYAGVALDLIEGLRGNQPVQMVLNIPNSEAITSMELEDIVEIPALVTRDRVQPLTVGEIPDHCLGLIKQVKSYERLTIAASSQGSYAKALLALTIHPLVRDYNLAKGILDAYIRKHDSYFPVLT